MAKILIVEDEEIIRTMLSTALAADGHTIIESDNGDDALAKVSAESPDIILTDMSLPKRTGWSLIESIRAETATSDVPIIALSAHVTSGDRDKAFEAGATAYEAKPPDVGRLRDKIEELLGT